MRFLLERPHGVYDALTWGYFSDHCRLAKQGTLGNRTVHVILATAEFFPIIGQIISLFEHFLIRLSSSGVILTTSVNNLSLKSAAMLDIPRLKMLAKKEIEKLNISYIEDDQNFLHENFGTHGMCQGSSQLFVDRYFSECKNGASIRESATRAAKIFQDTVPSRAVELQFLSKAYTPNKMLLSRAFPNSSEWEINSRISSCSAVLGYLSLGYNCNIEPSVHHVEAPVFDWENFPDGCYNLATLEINLSKKDKGYDYYYCDRIGHSIVLIKEKGSHFLFDPDTGLIDIRGSVSDFFNRYLKSVNFNAIHLVAVDPKK